MSTNFATQMRDYQVTLNHIYTGADAKSNMTIGKWCDRTRTTIQANRVIQDQLKAAYEDGKALYSVQENNRRWSELQTEQETYNRIARERIENDLDNVLTAKGKAFSKAMAAPDDASIRLLQTLQMREHISAAEISATAEHLAGNLQALSVLADISSRNGIAFPKLNTDFLTTAEETRESASRLLDDLFKDEQTYMAALFMHETGNNGQFAAYVDSLDNPAYFSCNVSEIVDKPARGEADAVTESV